MRIVKIEKYKDSEKKKSRDTNNKEKKVRNIDNEGGKNVSSSAYKISDVLN